MRCGSYYVCGDVDNMLHRTRREYRRLCSIVEEVCSVVTMCDERRVG